MTTLNNQPQQQLVILPVHFFSQQASILHNRQLIFTVLITLLSISLAAALWLSLYHSTKLQQQADEYGEDITQLVSIQIPSLMAGNNRIGLQALLNQVVDRKYAINGTLYDVDNQVIVHAGKQATGHNQHHSYTQSITLDEALIGSLTLTIENHNNKLTMLPFCILIALMSAIAMVIYYVKFPKPVPTPVKASPKDEDTVAAKNSQAPKSCLLAINLCDMTKLQQQLSAHKRQEQFDRLHECLEKVLTLYSGRIISTNNDIVVIELNNDCSENNVLNALCCAHILLAMRQQEQWLMAFSTIVYQYNEKSNIVNESLKFKRLDNVIGRNPRLLIDNNLVTDNLQNSLIVEEITSNEPLLFKQVTDLKGPKLTLLKNQINQLLKHS